MSFNCSNGIQLKCYLPRNYFESKWKCKVLKIVGICMTVIKKVALNSVHLISFPFSKPNNEVCSMSMIAVFGLSTELVCELGHVFITKFK